MNTSPAAESDSDSPVALVESTRGNLVESVHFGSYSVVDSTGKPLLAGGTPAKPMYARSSLKPLQSVAMVRAGLDLPDDLLALSAASHSGAGKHQEGAQRILALHGLDQAALRNVVDLPYGVAEREAWLRGGGVATQLAQNCSGKHAAMLATCVINGWTLDDYLAPEHPLQKHVEATLNELTGESAAASTVDGCGTPLFAYSLNGLARSYAMLAAAATGTPEWRVVTAMRSHPDMVAGEGRDVTLLTRLVPDLFAKDGAEAVQLVGLRPGVGIAVKISDGYDRARLPITLRLLEAMGIPSELLQELPNPAILGGGRAVGELRATESVIKQLRPMAAGSAK
ncbi:asparaginase [Paenarthrobacter ureafaciens]|uniref:asparaginase n=1 Tax=Paenarthrobacter ureafaciens TaxID=37931 RepID=UPI001A99ED24|nr:asparaginase [Paenarthrobacter ureafaciens]QSZ55615.1 asparaginase [Paenarthrobacter ureafaciens]